MVPYSLLSVPPSPRRGSGAVPRQAAASGSNMGVRVGVEERRHPGLDGATWEGPTSLLLPQRISGPARVGGWRHLPDHRGEGTKGHP